MGSRGRCNGGRPSLTTAGLGGMQSDEIAFEGLRRAVDAFNDLDTVAILQKSL